MNFALIAGFVMLAIPAFFTPGPNNLMLMTSAAKFGPRRTLAHGLGIVLGFPLMVFLVGLGLGEIFVAFPLAKTVLRYASALYFVWMAWHLLGLKVGEARGRERPLTTLEGALFQWINPKAWVMGVSFVGAFVPAGPGHLTGLLWLTLGTLCVAPLSTATWMFFGHQLESFLRKTGTERYLGAILAVLMMGAVLLVLL